MTFVNCHVGRHRQADPETRNETNQLQQDGRGASEVLSLAEAQAASPNEAHWGARPGRNL